MTEICIESFSLSVRLLIVTLMEGIKIVVTDKHHFDDRDESLLVTTSWKNWTIKFLMQGHFSLVFQSKPSLEEKTLPLEILFGELFL